MTRLLRSEWTWLVVCFVLLTSLPDGTALHTVVLVVVAVGWLAFLALRQPAAAAGLIVLGAAYLGGLAVLAAPALVVLLGYRATRSFRWGPVPGRWRRLAVVALLAALATIPFAGLGYERAEPGLSGSRRLRSGAEPGVGGSSLLEAIARLLRGLPPPPEDPTRRWWLWALAALVLLLLVAIVAWLLRRRRRAVGLATASVVARLESVGRRVGRRRRPDEGVLSYAAALAARTGDQRLGLAGPEVSALVYRSGAASGERVEQALGSLEAVPPPRPPRRSLSSRWRSLRSGIRTRVTPQRATFGVAGVMLLVGAVAVVVPRLSRLDGPADGAWSLWDEPGSTVEQWWSCETLDLWPVARTGVDHKTLDRAVLQSRGLAGPDDGRLERMGTWDGESFFTNEGDEYQLPREAAPPRLPFTTADAVLARFGITDPVVSTQRDATGATYTRYESLPLAEVGPDGGGIRKIGGLWEISAVFALDVWLDGSGRPVRVREMVNGDPGRFEWLRLPEPTGSSNPPPCSESDAAGDGPWLGAEPWTPSLQVPLKVAYDGAGHPYDVVSVPPGVVWRPIGDGLVSPTGIAAVTALEALSSDPELEHPAETVAVPPGTTLRVEQFEAEEAGEANRIRLRTGGDVSRWRQGIPLDLEYFTPVVAVAGPGFDPDRLSDAYDHIDSPDWAGRHLDLDDDGVDDALVLSRYGGTTVVYLGEDAAGRTVELVTVTPGLPWRLLDLPGPPPPDVVARERQLSDCLAGTRPLRPDGVCTYG